MKYRVKKVGNFYQAWQIDGHKVIKKGWHRLSEVDAFMDAKQMERVEDSWAKKKTPQFP